MIKKRFLSSEALSFVAPLIIFISIFILIPILGTVVNSLFKDVSFLNKKFIFLNNYIQLLADPSFWQSLRFNLVFVAVSVPLELFLGLWFALILNQPSRLKSLMRACVLIPWAIPTAIAARIWELIYNFNYGLANYILQKIGLTTQPINWLGSNFGAFFSIVAADVWKTTPFIAIILLAGLQTIHPDLNDQSKVDGSNFLQRLWFITLPLLKPAIIVALLFRTIDALRIFDLIYILTNGGPGGASASLSLHGYNYFIAGDFGYGSAISVLLFMIAMSLSVAYVYYGKFHKEVT